MLDFFVWVMFMLALLVAVILRLLAAKDTPWHVHLSMFVSWFMAVSLVALVPLDIHLVYLKRCVDHYVGRDLETQERACSVKEWRDGAGVMDGDTASRVVRKWLGFLKTAWIVIWSICQINGWILLTFQSSFIESRRFTYMGKFLTAMWDNLGFYAAMGVMSAVGFLFIWLFGGDLEFVIFSCLALFNCMMLCTVSAFLGYGQLLILLRPQVARETSVFDRGHHPCSLVSKKIFKGIYTTIFWNGSRIVETIKHHLYQVKTTYDTWTLAAEDLASKLVQVYYLRSRYDTVYGMAAPRHNLPTHAPAHSLAPHQNSSLPSRNAEDQSIRTVDPQDQLDRRISKEMDAAQGTPAGRRTSDDRDAGHTASDVTTQMPLSGAEAVGRVGGVARGGAGSDSLGLNGVNLFNEIEQIILCVCVCVRVLEMWIFPPFFPFRCLGHYGLSVCVGHREGSEAAGHGEGAREGVCVPVLQLF
jgi:hypothetical protein